MARLRPEVPVFTVAAASFRYPGLPGHGVPRGAAQTQDGIPVSTRPDLQLFTSFGPTPAATGTPRERGAIEQAACQSSGTFPGVGRPGPQHFLVPTQCREPVERYGARAWPGPLASSSPDPRLDAESGELCPQGLTLGQAGTTTGAEPPSWKGEDRTGSTTLGAACLRERRPQLLSA